MVNQRADSACVAKKFFILLQCFGTFLMCFIFSQTVCWRSSLTGWNLEESKCWNIWAMRIESNCHVRGLQEYVSRGGKNTGIHSLEALSIHTKFLGNMSLLVDFGPNVGYMDKRLTLASFCSFTIWAKNILLSHHKHSFTSHLTWNYLQSVEKITSNNLLSS